MKYILKKGDEVIEVSEGREERRDQLVRAGYEWVNAPQPEPTEPDEAGQTEKAPRRAKKAGTD